MVGKGKAFGMNPSTAAGIEPKSEPETQHELDGQSVIEPDNNKGKPCPTPGCGSLISGAFDKVCTNCKAKSAKSSFFPEGKCVRCRKQALDGSRWCYDCSVNAPRCKQCQKYPAGFQGNIRSTLCYPCVKQYNAELDAQLAARPKVSSKEVIAGIRDKKRAEAIRRGEICYRCGKGSPNPGHELCYGCEQKTAKRPAKKRLGRMPESCMYGWCGEFARTLDSPLDVAYPVVLAVAAGYGVPTAGRLRPNLYVNIIGRKGTGKTRVIERTLEAWQPPSPHQVVRKYPGSEVGLIQLLGGKKAKDMDEEDFVPKPYLLAQDEMRITFGKMGIQGSALPNAFNELFYRDDFGTASKQGHWSCVARMSMVGGLTCDGPDEFAEIYGEATAQGTHDRTIFAPFPDDWEFDDLWEPARDEFRRAGHIEVPREIYETVKEWRRKDPESRRRLGELALRVALVTASVNHDKEITPECLRCALEFIEWQEQVRAQYKPSESDDLDGRAERAIIRALEEHEGWVEWRDLCTGNNLYRAAKSANRLNRAKKVLVWESIIEEEFEEKNENVYGEKRTGRVRLKR